LSDGVYSKERFIQQGYVSVVPEPCSLVSVVATGIIVTAYCPDRGLGGLCNFSHPRRIGGQSTAVFAAPSIYTLVTLFREHGIKPHQLEAQIFGGAENPSHQRHRDRLATDNCLVAQELLEKFGIPIVSKEVGGKRARKIIFHSGTGETIIAKVSKVRDEDWYPHYIPEMNRRMSARFKQERRK
jgi:chemotaxis protein CheD